MRQEHDVERDIMVAIYSDELIANTQEYTHGGVRHVMHMDASGRPVRAEIHGYSKLIEQHAKTERKEYRLSSEGNPKIGEVTWQITDCKTGHVLDNGKLTPHLNDVSMEVISDPEKTLVSSHFPISDLFTFGMAGGYYPQPEVSGFALKVNRTDQQTFCWEWFDVDAPGHAVKRQESGEIAFEMADRGSGWEIVRTELLTDVSLRVMVMSGEGSGPDKVDWRVLVRKGSWVDWPSAADGHIVTG